MKENWGEERGAVEFRGELRNAVEALQIKIYLVRE